MTRLHVFVVSPRHYFFSPFFNVEEIRDVLGRKKKIFPIAYNFSGGKNYRNFIDSIFNRLIGWNDRRVICTLNKRKLFSID